jgi:hypothetical protein
MQEAKLTVRMPREVIEAAKRYARENDTTLTRLLSHYMQRLVAPSDPLAEAPIVRRLSGVLSPLASERDYREFLVEKHGSTAQDPH